MATIVLQAVGSAVGSFFGGPIGAAVGQTLGAVGGSYIDQRLFGSGGQTITGPRLETAQVLSSREGNTIPKVFGHARVAGEIIWATRFEEVQKVETRSQGGKGGRPKTTVRSFEYFANFAVGLCEGEIAGIRRVWADGKLLDRTETTIRIHKGDENQLPDSLIEAKQGDGQTPAYRGLAYVVFEHFALVQYGNRIPQIAVEVIRPIGELERVVTAVNMIPGATEFGYDTLPVVESTSPVNTVSINRNQTVAQTDFEASLDDLIATCPNLQQIALVVAWFGDDLRAEHCTVRPKVEIAHRSLISGDDWKVAGISRDQALLISQHEGGPAYGGTPSDTSVLRAIAAIKGRGLKVCLNPFIMMDVPASNSLPDPYGGNGQAQFPWRGRITCHPATGEAGTVNGSAVARVQVDGFVGAFEAEQITELNGLPTASGEGLWTYRHLILHYAKIAELAGGVDMFLIGSEMRGLTQVRDNLDQFPFVDALNDLASEVSSILGQSCLITYGADWSEYFGLQPGDGSGNVYYNLDPLWANPAIGAVGIDNYMPVSDWRRGGDPDGLGKFSSDPAMLRAQLAAGEGFDWYYADDQARKNAQRTPITDGLGKPWVFRYKDLKSWWSQPHHERRGGVELQTPSPWVPMSKPIIFTEYGCPAVHNGAAQPNVFFDPKSSESALPHGSSGARDDQVQANYILAHWHHWNEQAPNFEPANNPSSPHFSGRMVDIDQSQLWAWDARPFPDFPGRSDLWKDADNWYRGHWLNGRLGSVRLSDLIADVLLASGLATFDVSQVQGTITGFVIADAASARSSLEALLSLYRIIVHEDAGTIVFRSPGHYSGRLVSPESLLLSGNQPLLAKRLEQETELPVSVRLGHIDPDNAYEVTETGFRRINSNGKNKQSMVIPLVVSRQQVSGALEAWLQARWNARQSISLSVSRADSEITVGDELILVNAAESQRWRVTRTETSDRVEIQAVAVETGEGSASIEAPRKSTLPVSNGIARPIVHFLDLPHLGGGQQLETNLVAAAAVPWPGSLAVYNSPSNSGFEYRQSLVNSAFIGQLLDAVPAAHSTSRWSLAESITMKLFTGTVSSADRLLVLNGSNALAIRSQTGEWEILQFVDAELIGEKTWRLSKVLRGQAGSETQAFAGAAAGADLVVLNEAVTPLENIKQALGLETNWLVGPGSKAIDGPSFVARSFAPGYRGQRPFSPAHLRASYTASGDIAVSWVRRNRIDGDDWAPIDIPMNEQSEAYRVRIEGASGSFLEIETPNRLLTVPSSQLGEAFASSPETLVVTVAQLSATHGPGSAATTQMSL